MLIRNTNIKEFSATENLTREAFWNVYKPGCDEHLVLHNARQHSSFVKELDCVIEEGGRVVAHIMYVKTQLINDKGEATEVLTFGPVSVEPSLQKHGYGSAIINYTLDIAHKLGYSAVLITGNPDYYHRFGFVSASALNIRYPNLPLDDDAPFFMVKTLNNLPQGNYLYVEPEVYTVDQQQLEQYDKQFTPKLKEKRAGQLFD